MKKIGDATAATTLHKAQVDKRGEFGDAPGVDLV